VTESSTSCCTSVCRIWGVRFCVGVCNKQETSWREQAVANTMQQIQVEFDTGKKKFGPQTISPPQSLHPSARCMLQVLWRQRCVSEEEGTSSRVFAFTWLEEVDLWLLHMQMDAKLKHDTEVHTYH